MILLHYFGLCKRPHLQLAIIPSACITYPLDHAGHLILVQACYVVELAGVEAAA